MVHSSEWKRKISEKIRRKNEKIYRFNRKKIWKLIVIKRDLSQKRYVYWYCNCDCGTIEKSIHGAHLKSGNTSSCGCYSQEERKRRATKHNMTNSLEHKTWLCVINRCYNKNDPKYKWWGGRGITICNEWKGKEGFQNFYKDMGNKPGPEYSLDRIDNDGNYEPSNCKWATQKEQQRNKRSNKIQNIEEANNIRKLYKTGNYTQQELADSYNCNRATISYIITNKTWT